MPVATTGWRALSTGIALLLIAATGAIHAWIAIERLMIGLQQSATFFGGMAAGYFGGLLLYLLGIGRRWLLHLAPLYVLLLIGAWLVAGERTPLAYIDKLIEVVLVAVLAIVLYLYHRMTAGARSGQPAA